jgi:hypothetical protein
MGLGKTLQTVALIWTLMKQVRLQFFLLLRHIFKSNTVYENCSVSGRWLCRYQEDSRCGAFQPSQQLGIRVPQVVGIRKIG